MDPATAIQTVLNTLGQIELKGIRNMDYMLGAVRLLERIQDDLKTRADAQAKPAEAD